MGIKESAARRPTVYAFELGQFHLEDGWNSRVHDASYREHIDNFKNSIREALEQSQGTNLGIPPISGRWNGEVFDVKAGFSRITALRELAEEGLEIPAIIVSLLPDQPASKDFLVQIIENSGKPLSVLEQAEVCRKFIEQYQLENTEADLPEAKEAFSKALKGVSRQHVDNLLHLINAPEDIKEKVVTGQMSASTAIEAIKDYGEAAPEIVQEAIEKNGKATKSTLEAVAQENGVEKQRKSREKKEKTFTEPEEFRFKDGMSREDVVDIVNNYDFSLLSDRDLAKVLKVISL